eukprot:363186-Chlamydomonas_euryale.AAC.1
MEKRPAAVGYARRQLPCCHEYSCIGRLCIKRPSILVGHSQLSDAAISNRRNSPGLVHIYRACPLAASRMCTQQQMCIQQLDFGTGGSQVHHAHAHGYHYHTTVRSPRGSENDCRKSVGWLALHLESGLERPRSNVTCLSDRFQSTCLCYGIRAFCDDLCLHGEPGMVQDP